MCEEYEHIGWGPTREGVAVFRESVSRMCEECKHIGWGPTREGVAVLRERDMYV